LSGHIQALDSRENLPIGLWTPKRIGQRAHGPGLKHSWQPPAKWLVFAGLSWDQGYDLGVSFDDNAS